MICKSKLHYDFKLFLQDSFNNVLFKNYWCHTKILQNYTSECTCNSMFEVNFACSEILVVMTSDQWKQLTKIVIQSSRVHNSIRYGAQQRGISRIHTWPFRATFRRVVVWLGPRHQAERWKKSEKFGCQCHTGQWWQRLARPLQGHLTNHNQSKPS